jgi:uncharacterized protein (TIGR03382 family)
VVGGGCVGDGTVIVMVWLLWLLWLLFMDGVEEGGRGFSHLKREGR